MTVHVDIRSANFSNCQVKFLTFVELSEILCTVADIVQVPLTQLAYEAC